MLPRYVSRLTQFIFDADGKLFSTSVLTGDEVSGWKGTLPDGTYTVVLWGNLSDADPPLEKVENGGGKNGKVEGYQVGGKTATSETLPRGTGRYISSFLGFAPADDPKVLALCIIRNPQGVYYGGLVAAPVVRELFENILPYLDEIEYYEKNETVNRK